MHSFVNRLIRLDHFIHCKGTGRPIDLANKLNVSERTIFEYLRLMKDMGAPISFSRLRGTYYYKDNGKFAIGFFPGGIPDAHLEAALKA